MIVGDNLNKKKLLSRIMNNQKNVLFNDFITVVEAYGFNCTRREGSHQIFKSPNVTEFINLQDENGKAKPYQIKQFLYLIEKYKLEMEE